MIIDNKEQIQYVGGASISAALVNSILASAKFLYSVGQEVGSSIYRYIRKISC